MLGVNFSEPTSREKKLQQLKDWDGSLIDKASSEYHAPTRVTFPLNVKLTAACYAVDKKEFKKLLTMGADVNGQNPDGMTCAHQCCISNEVDFLQFIIEEGADVNIQDNEGWTPLHAASSVGSEDAIRLLLKNGADISVLTCDMELPLDVASTNEVRNLLEDTMKALDLDASKLRNREEQLMLKDAQHWKDTGVYSPSIDPRTGASPLHVAACKEYTSVLATLLKLPGINVDVRDLDGWTPLHAAAHWNHEEAAKMLCESGASFDVYTASNLSVFDVADQDMIVVLRQLRDRQRSAQKRALTAIKTESPSDKLENSTSSAKVNVPVEVNSTNTARDNGDHIVPPVSEKSRSPEVQQSSDSDTELTDNTHDSSESTSSSLSSESSAFDTPVSDIVTASPIPASVVSSVPSQTTAATEMKTELSQEECSVMTTSQTTVSSVSPPAVSTEAVLPNGIGTTTASNIGSRINRLMEDYVKPPEDSFLPPHPLKTKATANLNTSSELTAAKLATETETQRSVKARHIRQSRRSTQRVSLSELEEAKQMIDSSGNINNDTTTTTAAAASTGPSPLIVSDSTTATPRGATVLIGSNQNRLDKNVSQATNPSKSVPSDITSGTAASPSSYRRTPRRFQNLETTKTPVIPDGSSTLSNQHPVIGRGLLNPVSRIKLDEATEKLERLVKEDSSDASKPGATDHSSNFNKIIPRPSSPFLKKSSQPEREGSLLGQSKKSSASSAFSTALSRFSGIEGLEKVDYQHLYEKEKMEKERLLLQLERIKREQKHVLRSTSDCNNNNGNNKRTEALPDATADLRSKLLQLEDQVKEVATLREENNRLRDENASLVRVISKLSRPSG